MASSFLRPCVRVSSNSHARAHLTTLTHGRCRGGMDAQQYGRREWLTAIRHPTYYLRYLGLLPTYLIVGHHHHDLSPPFYTHCISPSTSTSNPVRPRYSLRTATLVHTRRHVSSPPVSSAQLIPHDWPGVCADISPAISSCAARPQASPSADSATNATANAPSATLTCDRRPWCESAMSAPLGTTRTSVSCAVARASRTHSTASNVRV